MKRFIVCFVLVISIMLSLCACYPKTIDEQGVERRAFYKQFVVIEDDEDYSVAIVYQIHTKVVYFLRYGGKYGSFLSPYQIYQDGALYGAIFQDGEIVPVPYAYAPLE